MQKLIKLILLQVFFYSTVYAQKTLVISFPSQFDSIDPTKAWSYFQHLVINAHCSTLTRLTSEGETVGNLLESWSVSSDLKVYKFKLRKNIRMHDGSLLEAVDVAFSLSRHFWLDEKSNYREHLSNVFGYQKLAYGTFIKNIHIVDALQFDIKLDNPYIPLLNMLSQSGLCIVKNMNPHISTGAMIAKYNSAKRIWELNKFKDYFLEPSFYDQIIVESELDGEKTIQKMKKHKVNLSIGNHLRFLSKSVVDHIKVSKVQSLSFNHFLINRDRPNLSVLSQRRMLGEILQQLSWKSKNMSLFETAQDTIIPRGLLPSHYYQRASVKTPLNDLLKELAKSTTIKKPLDIVLVGRDHSSSFVQDLVKAFKLAHIPLNLRIIAGPEYRKILDSGEYDVISYGFLNAFADPDGFFVNFEKLMGKRKTNNSNFSSPADEAASYRHLTDKSDRANKYATLFRNLESEWILIPIYRTFYPIVSDYNIVIPETMFLNSFELWKLKEKPDEAK